MKEGSDAEGEGPLVGLLHIILLGASGGGMDGNSRRHPVTRMKK